MFWQEDDNQETTQISDDIIDLVFNITSCRELPVDHAYALGQALIKALPLIGEDERIAVHNIHLAGSQNGWERPNPSLGQKLVLSKRTKLTLRIPQEHKDTIANALNGVTLDIDGHPLTLGSAKTKSLSKQGTLFSRYIVLEDGEDQDENRFLLRMVNTLKTQNIPVKKALCGITQHIDTPEGSIATRSIMLAGLNSQQAIQLQQRCIGGHRHMGCGIFIPHKGIDAVKQAEDE
jgi:CRISPR-associated protein Cas6